MADGAAAEGALAGDAAGAAAGHAGAAQLGGKSADGGEARPGGGALMRDGRLRVYVAGPYSQGDQIDNVRQAVLAGHEILMAGHLPFVPHVCHFAHYLIPQSYETWMEFDLAWLETCHCLVRLAGASLGADREVERAKMLGMPIYLGLEDFHAQVPTTWARGENRRG